jgi:hypothetical protein
MLRKALRGGAKRRAVPRCGETRRNALPIRLGVGSRSKLCERRKYRYPLEMTHYYLLRYDRSTFGWFSRVSATYLRETHFRIDLDQHGTTLLEGLRATNQKDPARQRTKYCPDVDQ